MTHSTSLADGVLEPLLRLVKTGDDRDAAKRGHAPASQTRSSRKVVAVPEAGPATMRAAEVSETTKAASVKLASAKEPEPSSKHVAETAVATPKLPSVKEPKPPSKQVAEAPKPVPSKAAEPSSKRAKAPSNAPPREINDEVIFKGMERKLKRENTEDPVGDLKVLKHIWLHGGREATLAWMSGEGSKFKSVVNAFDKWAGSHPAEVKAALANYKKSQEAPTSAKAA